MQELISWSFGKNRFDNMPVNHSGSFSEFVQFCADHKAAEKGLNYITPKFENDGRRCLVNAPTRDFLAFDMDGCLTDQEALLLTEFFSGVKGFCYETASSQKDMRRMRFIVIPDQAVTNEQSKIVSRFIEWTSKFGDSFDPCTHGLAQPIYLPPVGKDVLLLHGEPFKVAPVLQMYSKFNVKSKPKQKPRVFAPADTPDVYEYFARSGLILKEASYGGWDVICLWADGHTNGDITGTVLYPPAAANNYAGGFKCQHHHCEYRSIADVYKLIRGGA